MFQTNNLWILIICICLSRKVEPDPVYTQAPGIVDVSSGNSAELAWTIDQSLNDFLWSKIVGQCGSSRMYTFRKNGFIADTPYAGRLQGFLRNNNQTHGFILSGVKVDDTLCRYSIEIYNSASGGPTNDQAWIRILGVPSVPVISMNPTEAVAGTVITLTCSASSTTQPPDQRPAMKYTWSRTSGSIPGDRHSVSGSNSETLTINTVQKQDNQQTYSCTAQEEGSSLGNNRSLKLNVKYRPGSAVVTADLSTVVEAVNDLRLTCSLPSGQEGNPAVYTYQWRRPDGSLHPTDTKPLLISRSVLTATDHQGTWRCTAQNDVGLGTTGRIYITINAKPSVTKQPTNTSPIINEDLHIECQFLAKPGASVSWRYGASGTPSSTALKITTTVTSSGLYNKTTSIISWRSGSSYSDRKAVSGQYTCVASNSPGTTESITITLNVRYGPLSINLGPDSQTEEVVEGSGDTVSRTCAADCNPPCNYVWTNITSGLVESNQALLDLGQPDRYDHGLYKCTADNTIWANNTQFSLTVFFPPEPSFTTSNQSTLIQGNSTSLICSVASRPDSSITLYNLTGSKELESEISDNTAQHTLPQVHCLDTGSYLCMAKNTFLGASHVEDSTILMDVKCPPGIFKPYTNTEGSAVRDNVTFQVTLLSNPKPVITTDNWSFIQNGTKIDTLPSNVAVVEGQATDRLTVVAMLFVNNIQLYNYGIYTLTTSNGYGGPGPIQFTLTPQGPPGEPSVPQLITRTAVSFTISWIAGSNGGFMQTFKVLYRAQDSGQEISAAVDTYPAVNKGDVIVYKLSDPYTILPGALYTIRVQASNKYQGGSTVYGDSADVGTKAKPEVVTDPQYNFNSTHMTVKITIQPVESVSHLVTRVCPGSTTVTCNQENTTVTTPDVTVTVELPATAKTYTLTLTMYDGEDQVNKMETTEKMNGDSTTAAVAGGVVGGLLLAAAVIVIIIVLWRKGIIHRKGKAESKEERNEPVQQYDNINVLVMDGDQGTTGPGVESTLYEGIADTTLREVNTQTYQGMNQLTSSTDKGIYEGLASSAMNVISSTCTKVVGVFSENAVYKVSLAKPLKLFQKSLPKNLTVKKIQDAAKYPSHHAYLEGAAEAMVRLVNCDNTINCLGLACGKTELLMEHAPFGTLRQYLTGVTEGTYANSIKNQFHDQMNFIHQACNGASAVAELEPQCLFHSLSADNALLAANNTIKLTGFATASHVKAREIEERENKLPRPVRWLAPEAIDLRHCTQSDVWGFGVLMWEILCLGKTPFEEIEDNSIRTHIGKGHSPTKPDTCSDEMYDQMRLCWQMKAENRPTLADIKSDLQATTIYQNI